VSMDNGRIGDIVRAAIGTLHDPQGSMLGLIPVIRKTLAAEHEDGYKSGHADGVRDCFDAQRYDDDRARAIDSALTGTEATS
jgi:hypothetical protein